MKSIASSLFSPIIVMQGFEKDLPPALKSEIHISRMLNPNRDTATDAEVLGYLSTWSIASPLPPLFASIYLTLGNQFLRKKTGQNVMPQHDRKFNEEETKALEDLKAWIFKTQQKHLAKKGK
jgi:hypothetical protein